MKPKYQFVFDEFGNVIFLDYVTENGPDYSNYNYRWVWSKQDRNGLKEWFLVPFPQFHWKSLDLLPEEMKLAAQAYEDIKKWEADGK